MGRPRKNPVVVGGVAVSPDYQWHLDEQPPGVRPYVDKRLNKVIGYVVSRDTGCVEYFDKDSGEWTDSPVLYNSQREAIGVTEKFARDMLPSGCKGGVLVHVYRCVDDMGPNGYDGTLNGLTSRYNQAVLIGSGIEQVCAPSNETVDETGNVVRPAVPILVLQKGSILGMVPHYYAVPVAGLGNVPFSYGGNLISTSDSRFKFDALKVHDRFED